MIPSRILKQSLTLVTVVTLGGCSVFEPKVPEDVKTKYTSNLPKGTLTNFNEAIACMDNLMLVHEVAPIYVSSQGLANYTSDHTISLGGMEMLITALSKMSIRSNGVRFVSYNADIANMMTLQSAHPNRDTFRVPDYFIRGGVTQHNKALWNGQRGSGASVEMESPNIIDGGTFFTLQGQEDATTSYSLSSSYGTLTMDMSAGFISNLQIVPGVASANTLALENRKGKSITADLAIGDLGYSYSFSDNKSYDFNNLYRSLIEVGAIEIVGKLQKVPYWRCLANAGQVEQRDRELLASFVVLQNEDPERLIKGAQDVLQDLDFYDGDPSGLLTQEVQESLQEYQRQMGLIATGQLNFETYRMMSLFTPTVDAPASYWWQSNQGIPLPPVAQPDAGASRKAKGGQ